jgi:hypothetical protein
MSKLYSTVGQKEIERAVGKVISMARLTLSGPEGMHWGCMAKMALRSVSRKTRSTGRQVA